MNNFVEEFTQHMHLKNVQILVNFFPQQFSSFYSPDGCVRAFVSCSFINICCQTLQSLCILQVENSVVEWFYFVFLIFSKCMS